MLERDIERTLVQKARSRGGAAWKFTSPGRAGVPDRLVLLPHGMMGFVELKAPGRRPRPLQHRRMDELKRLGYKVFVVDGKEQIGGVLDAIQTP